MCGCIDDTMNSWRSEDNFYELILSTVWVELNSDHQAWQQAPIPAEPAHWPWCFLEAGSPVALASIKLT